VKPWRTFREPYRSFSDHDKRGILDLPYLQIAFFFIKFITVYLAFMVNSLHPYRLQTLEGHSGVVSSADPFFILASLHSDEVVIKAQQPIIEEAATSSDKPRFLIMLKTCCDSQQIIGQRAQLCQADVSA
jgi:hypothetical protein